MTDRHLTDAEREILESQNPKPKTYAQLAVEETEKRLAWEAVTKAFDVEETRIENGKAVKVTRPVMITEARSVFDSLLHKANVRPEDWKSSFWVTVSASRVFLCMYSIEFFQGALPTVTQGQNPEACLLRAGGYCC